MKTIVVAVIAGLITFASAVDLVLCRHQSRRLFVELQSLHEIKQGLDQEWGQLLLEQATWGAELRVEQIANEKLGMVVPSPSQVVELQ
jgi:cell division protein FtsL